MNAHTLTAALKARKDAIDAAWFHSKAAPGSHVYRMWADAYSLACKRYYRASFFLPRP